MSFRPSPTIETADIEKILVKWKQDRKSLKEEFKRPVLLFVGGAGVGKSSCIKVLFNITKEDELKQLNITDHGQCGTTGDRFRYESEYRVAIDIRGKLQDQNTDQYIEYVSKILKQGERIDIIIGVVDACGDRTGNIDELIDTLRIICKEHEKPFVVLMNKVDRVKVLKKVKQFEGRKQYLEEECDRIRKDLSWKYESHPLYPHGVFPVSAEPIQSLIPECPNQECARETKKKSKFHSAAISVLIEDAALHCTACKKVYILDSQLENMDRKDIEEFAQSENLPIVNHEILPIGLEHRSQLMQAIPFLANELVGYALMKSTSATLSDYIVLTSKIIHTAVQKIYGKKDAIEVDRSLCAAIARAFGLEQSAVEHSEYEASRWEKVGRLDRFTSFIRMLFDRSDQGLAYYMAAWGIYYARKFHDIAVTINDNFQDNTPTIQIANQCNEICARYTEIQQLEYYEFILQTDLETAIQKYIIEYRKPDTSNTVGGNQNRKYNRPNLGKT